MAVAEEAAYQTGLDTSRLMGLVRHAAHYNHMGIHSRDETARFFSGVSYKKLVRLGFFGTSEIAM